VVIPKELPKQIIDLLADCSDHLVVKKVLELLLSLCKYRQAEIHMPVFCELKAIEIMLGVLVKFPVKK
jgi:hypothetical protein